MNKDKCVGQVGGSPLYVTLANPAGGCVPFHTLLRVGCSRANGYTSATPAAQAIWGEFTDRIVQRADNPTTVPIQLSYYAGGFAHTTQTAVAELLRDGNGQCLSWADLLWNCWRVQGIVAGHKIRVEPLPPPNVSINYQGGFLVKNWTFSGSGSSTPTAPYIYIYPDDVTSATGVAGQNNDDPESLFSRHFIARYGNSFYDPSYGTGPFTGPMDWEHASLDGLIVMDSLWGADVYVKREDAATTETVFTIQP